MYKNFCFNILNTILIYSIWLLMIKQKLNLFWILQLFGYFANFGSLYLLCNSILYKKSEAPILSDLTSMQHYIHIYFNFIKQNNVNMKIYKSEGLKFPSRQVIMLLIVLLMLRERTGCQPRSCFLLKKMIHKV